MKFELTDDPERPHAITFEGHEVEIVKAVFREHIYNLARKGNTGSISRYDANVASWHTPKKNRKAKAVIKAQNYTKVTERFEEFHANTDDAISEITDTSGVPAFDNEDIARRFKLGQGALDLAIKVKEQVDVEVGAQRLDEQFTQYLSEQDQI